MNKHIISTDSDMSDLNAILFSIFKIQNGLQDNQQYLNCGNAESKRRDHLVINSSYQKLVEALRTLQSPLRKNDINKPKSDLL